MANIFVVAVWITTITTVIAHSRFGCPPPRSPDTDIKVGPCGSSPPGSVTEIKPGPMTILIEESIAHQGAPFRIALSEDGDDGHACTLLDHIPSNPNSRPDYSNPSTYTKYYVTVDIPNVDCQRCSLQLSNPMTDKTANRGWPNCSYLVNQSDSNPSSRECFSVYHSCSDLKITGNVSRSNYVCPTITPSGWPLSSPQHPPEIYNQIYGNWTSAGYLVGLQNNPTATVHEKYRTPFGFCVGNGTAPSVSPTTAPTTAAPSTGPTTSPSRIPTVASTSVAGSTNEPTPTPTSTPNPTPSPTTTAPTPSPTPAITNSPDGSTTTAAPTDSQTSIPTPRPTASPTPQPTPLPTPAPITIPPSKKQLRVTFPGEFDSLSESDKRVCREKGREEMQKRLDQASAADRVTIEQVVVSKGSIIVTYVLSEDSDSAAVSDLKESVQSTPITLQLSSGNLSSTAASSSEDAKAADTANNANGPNGEGCNGNGTKIDEVEFDNDFTCDCNSGFNVTASANCVVLNSPPSPDTDASSGGNGDEGIIIGTAVTLVVLIVLAVVVIVLLRKQRKQNQRPATTTPAPAPQFNQNFSKDTSGFGESMASKEGVDYRNNADAKRQSMTSQDHYETIDQQPPQHQHDNPRPNSTQRLESQSNGYGKNSEYDDVTFDGFDDQTVA